MIRWIGKTLLHSSQPSTTFRKTPFGKNRFLRGLIILSLCSAALCVLVVWVPDRYLRKVDRFLVRYLHAPAWLGTSAQQYQAEEEREILLSSTIKRREMKNRVAAEVIADRLSLMQAAVQFCEADSQAADFHWKEFRKCYSGATDEERFCRMVIAWVQHMLVTDPERADSITTRLQLELQEHLQRHGKVTFPKS